MSTYTGRRSKTPTARELDCLRAMAAGESTDETAARLGITAKSVVRLRQHVRYRLGAADVAQALEVAHAAGLL